MRWNDKADDDLRTLFSNDYSDEEIADYFGFEDIRTVSRRRQRLRLLRNPHRSEHKTWTERDIGILESTLHLTCDEVAERLNKTSEAINSMRKRLGLKSKRLNRWSKDQLQVLYQEYRQHGAEHVAKKTGRAPSDVWKKANAEGIRRCL